VFFSKKLDLGETYEDALISRSSQPLMSIRSDLF
jgi:hypothetical protein